MPYIVNFGESLYEPLVDVLQFNPPTGYVPPPDVGLSTIARLTIDSVVGLRELLDMRTGSAQQIQDLEEQIAYYYRSFGPKVGHSAVLDLLTTTLGKLVAAGARPQPGYEPVYEPPASVPKPFDPVTAPDPGTFTDISLPFTEPARLTIDSIVGLRELLDMQSGSEQQIEDLEQQIAHYYRRFPHAQAEAAVRDLLNTTMRNLQGPPALVPTIPEHRPGLLDPTLPGQMIIPPAGNGEPIDGNGEPIARDVPVDDEGTVLPLAVGAALFLLKVL